jgi:hypothetical protein
VSSNRATAPTAAAPATQAATYGPAVLTVRTGSGAVQMPATELQAVSIDVEAICFWPLGGSESGRALPWTLVRSISAVELDGDETHARLGDTSDAVGAQLEIATARFTYELTVLSVPPSRLVADLGRLAPATHTVTESAPRTVTSRFERVRPALRLLLVVAVATMAALVMAASTGAIHLSWLGGTAASTGLPVPGH